MHPHIGDWYNAGMNIGPWRIMMHVCYSYTE